MTLVRTLFLMLTVLLFASLAFAAGDGSDSHGSTQNQTADQSLMDQQAPASDLFFLKDRPRLNLTAPFGRARSAVMEDSDCFTMRMYKVKRKERLANGENGLLRYSTCEMASQYQMRTAVARSIESNDSPRK